MKEKTFKTITIELIFEKNTEVCVNSVDKINQLIRNGFVLKEATYSSACIESRLIFYKDEIVLQK